MYDIKGFKEVCSIEDSPYYIHKIALTDRLDNFKRLYDENPSRLNLIEPIKGWLPIHYAASKGKTSIISFILSKSREDMINSKDINGNTPLHICIEEGHLECVRFLLLNKADFRVKNKDCHTAIHYCIVHSKPDILDVILNDNIIENDVNIVGQFGSTPLHYCAYLNDIECAQVLVKHGASYCRPCSNGFYPVHLAVTRGSRAVLEFLISESTKVGCPIGKKMLTLVDSDNNKPLHAAVQFDNIEGVKLCLMNGSRIDETNEPEKVTAVHLACAQGSLELLELLFDSQPELKDAVIHMQDINLMTPLHKACMFDHVDVVDYLIQNGASLDTLDKEKRTPLLLAASRNCIRTVCFLLRENNVTNQKDAKLRNILHLILNQENACLREQLSLVHPSSRPSSGVVVSMPKSFDQVVLEILKNPVCSQMLNEQDVDGCTVMHYACQLCLQSVIQTLITHGARLNTPNHEKQSPLHFAAKYGRYNSCLELLSSNDCKKFINEKDVHGLTALHLAASNGHAKVVKLLMHKGALIYKSYDGDTPFHLAALNGHNDCMDIILNVDFQTLDSRNKNGDTALNIAARMGHLKIVDYLLSNNAKLDKNENGLTFIDQAIIHRNKQVLMTIIAHKRWQEALDLDSNQFKTPFLGLIEYSSDVTQTVLDRCIAKEDISGTRSKKYTVNYDFKYLIWSEESKDKKGKLINTPMIPLQHMIKHGRTECLSHPLCEKLLMRKWNRYGFLIYSLILIAYFMYLMMLTLVVTTYPSCRHDDLKETLNQQNLTFCNDEFHDESSIYRKFNNVYLYQIMAALCILYSILAIIKDIYYGASKGLFNLATFQTLIQFILNPTTIIFLVPFLIPGNRTYHFQWQAGSIAIFLAWFNLLLYLQRFHMIGIYVVMFTDILRTLLKVILLFSILLIGFGLAFYILMKDNKDSYFTSPVFSIFRMVLMMLGELDGINSYVVPYNDQSNITLHFSDLSLCFIILFIMLVPILLINLLIGLAVGDIEAILKDAKLKREAMQVQLLVNLEESLPHRIQEKIRESEFSVIINEENNKCGCIKNIFESLTNDSKHFSSIDPNDTTNKMIIDELTNQKQKLSLIETSLNEQMDYLRTMMQKIQI